MTCVDVFTRLEKIYNMGKIYSPIQTLESLGTGTFGYRRIRAFLKFVDSINDAKIHECFSEFLYFLNRLPYDEKYRAYSEFIENIKGKIVIIHKFNDLISFLNNTKLPPILTDDEPFDAFSHFFNAIKGTVVMESKYELLESTFIYFLNSIPLQGPAPSLDWRIFSFSDLICAIKDTELFHNQQSLIKNKMSLIISILGEANLYQWRYGRNHSNRATKYRELACLIRAIKNTELIKEFILPLKKYLKKLKICKEIYNHYDFEEAFLPLLEELKGTELFTTMLMNFLEYIEEGLDPNLNNNKYQFVPYESFYDSLCRNIDNPNFMVDDFSALMKSIKGVNFILEFFPDFMRFLDKLPYDSFYDFLCALEGTNVMELRFPELISRFNTDRSNGSVAHCSYKVFIKIINQLKNTNLLHEKLPELLFKFDTLKDFYKRKAFYDLIIAIKGTETLETHYSLLKKHFKAIIELKGDILQVDLFTDLEEIFNK